MFTTYFSDSQVFGLVFFGILHLISIYFFTYKNNIKYAMLFLFAGGFIARLLVIGYDDFLHMWDEQYHALVAKNMADMNSLVPVLYKNTPLKYCPTIWTEKHIWLHKQPLFLWQMALCIKVFGASIFSVRLPSAIMTSLLILVIFRTGKLIVNERTGYVASFLFTTCNYLLDFTTGIYATDHNDIAFIFYIALSIWAYTEYKISNNVKYIWLIGFFAGLAILNKWLVGLLVFSGWGISIGFFPFNKIGELKNMSKALLICILVFIPWQTYILIAFPELSRIEFAYNSRHFFEALEGHYGDGWFHFNQAVIQYGIIGAYALPLALLFLFFDIKNIAVRVSYIVFITVTYLFFSIAKTKMSAFCLIVSPIMFLALGNLLNRLITNLNHIKSNNQIIKLSLFVLLAVMGIVSIDIETLQRHHTEWIKNDLSAYVRNIKLKTMGLAISTKGKYDPEKTIVFNCSETENIPFMFFTGYTAYDRAPTFEEYDSLKKREYKIVFINDYYSPIPEYLKKDKEIRFISYTIKENPVHLTAQNGKFVCADGNINNLVVANRDSASEWETFLLMLFEDNKCAIRSYDNHFLCAELGHNNEITATRDKLGAWETFTLIELENNFIAFKAANEKYFTVDEKTGQLFANADSIGENEKFEMIIK